MDFGITYAVNAFVCMLLVMTMLLRSHFTRHKQFIDHNSDRLFRFFILFSAVDMLWGLLSSISSRGIPERIGINHRSLYLVFTYGFHLMAALSAFMWFGYLIYYVGVEKSARSVMNVVRITILVLQIAVLAANGFNGFAFTIDESSVYHPQGGRSLLFAFQFAYYFAFTAYALIRIFGRPHEKRRGYISAIIFSVTPLLFGFGQMFFPEIAMYSMGFAFSSVIIYVFNITESRERMLEARVISQDRKHTTIISALMGDYEAIFYVDLSTDSYEMFCSEPFAEAISGFPLRGRKFFNTAVGRLLDIVHKEDAAIVRAGLSRDNILSDLRMTGEIRFTCRVMLGGQPVFCEVRGVRSGERHENTKLIITIRNINAVTLELRRRTDEMQRLAVDRDTSYRLIHQTTSSGMWALSFDGSGEIREVEWSDEFRKLIGFTDEAQFPDSLSSWTDRIHPDDRKTVLDEMYATINDRSDEKTFRVEYRLETASGEWRWFRSAGRAVRDFDGTPVSFVGIFIDITDEHNRRELLVDALDKARSSDEAKTAFLFNMSHDIRTPMNAVLGFTELAEKNIDNRDKVLECIGKVRSSGRHLLGILNDILDMSQIESGNVRLDENVMSLDVCFETLTMMLGNLAAAKELSIVRERFSVTHLRVIADELRLKRIFMNILTNSIKYTGTGGTITYSVTETESPKPGCGRYVFRFSDNGIGMSREFLSHIFETFARERNTTLSGVQGTGLGMAITKSLTDMMGGTIRIDSEPGKGTATELTFDFRIAELPEPDAAAGSTDIDLKGKKILVAEDNMLNREIAVDILENYGMTVDTAENGRIAVDKVKASVASGCPSNCYDYILMDIQMPVMDGIEATSAIRAVTDPLNIHIPIIAMTANAFSEDRKRSREAGMDEHLSKPIDLNELSGVLLRLAGERKQ